MSSGAGSVVDIIVPEVFAPYVQILTEEKSRLIQSGAIARDTALDNALAGGGLTFHEPSFKDLDNDVDNVASATLATLSTPNKIGTQEEIQVRLSRNNSWSSGDLAADLAGADPMNAIANRVAAYWARRHQAAFVATLKGVFADNAAAPTGTEHVLNDMTNDVSGVGFVDGVTNFTAEAFIDAQATMGDSASALSMVMMHSIVYNRAKKNNLIDFIPDSRNPDAEQIPTFLGSIVIQDDGVPFTGGIFQTWLFGPGAVRSGMGSPKVPAETKREPTAGNGSGQDTLFSRTEWILHPVGYKFAIASPGKGGPDNTANAGMLAHLDSWQRTFPERKQIKIARLVTREF